jgi:hypothetical protein
VNLLVRFPQFSARAVSVAALEAPLIGATRLIYIAAVAVLIGYAEGCAGLMLTIVQNYHPPRPISQVMAIPSHFQSTQASPPAMPRLARHDIAKQG